MTIPFFFFFFSSSFFHIHTHTHSHVVLFSFRISASPESWHLRRFQRVVVNDHLDPSDAELSWSRLELEHVIHCSLVESDRSLLEPDRSLLEPDRFLLGPFATRWSALLGLTASRTKHSNIIQKHSLMVTTRRFLSGCITSRTIMACPTHIPYGGHLKPAERVNLLSRSKYQTVLMLQYITQSQILHVLNAHNFTGERMMHTPPSLKHYTWRRQTFSPVLL